MNCQSVWDWRCETGGCLDACRHLESELGVKNTLVVVVVARGTRGRWIATGWQVQAWMSVDIGCRLLSRGSGWCLDAGSHRSQVWLARKSWWGRSESVHKMVG